MLDAARAGAIRLDVSAAILDEVEHVLQAKFRWPPAKAKEARVEITRFANTVSPADSLAVVETDPADNRVIECAAAARSDYLVTGDKHLLVLASYRGTQIVKAAEFLRLGQQR